MKKILLFLSLLIASIACKNQARADGIDLISVKQFEEEYDPASDILLDVRTAKEYKEGYIKDAINVDVLDEKKFKQEIQDLDRDKTVYLYCRTGRRSAVASKLLKEEGFREIKDLIGGIEQWNKKKQE
ncbi:MAG: rhodanese-like domain-containing protein [Weeksellaceae bacterium]